MKYRHRIAENKVLELSKIFPVVLVTGARQCGKTTMLKYLSEAGREYVTLDDLNDRELAENDAELFFQKYKTPIFIDEIQYAPKLLNYIKKIVDKSQNPGEIWLSGSQDFLIMKNVSQSLAGRIGIIRMYPMLYQEINEKYHDIPNDFSFNVLNSFSSAYGSLEENALDINIVFDFIYKGGMPRTIEFDDTIRAEYFNSYIDTYLMKDIVEFGKVTDLLRFKKFVVALASQNTHQLNYANLADVAGISQPCAKDWLEILKAVGLIWELKPYYSNILKRLVKTPKVYFYDTGLCAHLMRIPSSEVLQNSAFSGAFFENFVLNLFKIKYSLNPKSPNLFYYRDVDKKEIDIVLEEFDGLRPLEIKLSANPDRGIIKTFDILKKTKLNIKPGGVLCLTNSLTPIDNANSIIPISYL